MPEVGKTEFSSIQVFPINQVLFDLNFQILAHESESIPLMQDKLAIVPSSA